MKNTLGNFTTQANQDFPIDTQTFESLQNNQALLSVLGNIAGDKAILKGCEPEQNGTLRKEGYVFLRTQDFPQGEVLYWEGGSVSAGMYLKKEIVAISAHGYEFPQAYTIRSLAAGIGEENYSWATMKTVSTIPELEQKNAELRLEIAKLTPPPLGVVQIWAGVRVPVGYTLCEGQQLAISDYPELYTALGTTFNNGRDCNGNTVTTTKGFFRLPDLRGRFIVGYNPGDPEYVSYGKVGGEKKHLLTGDEMPAHSHDYKAPLKSGDHPGGSSGYDRPNSVGSGITASTGGGASHENRPPFYTLAYIMRVK